MSSDLSPLVKEFDAALAAVRDSRALTDVRNTWLAKKGGRVTGELARLRSVPAEDKRAFGQAVNDLKEHVERALETKAHELDVSETRARLLEEAVDPTLPALMPDRGGLHPIRLIQDEIEAIFTALGYTVEHGPEVEDDHHNFEALNIPADHPARDSHDTFYLPDGHLLRTHTSPVQIHAMRSQPPPLRII